MNQEEAINTDNFRTLSVEGSALYKEKGSKFVAYSFAVNTVEQALSRLAELKARYHDARHHCFAYRIDPENPQFRANDDGEPSNSAGMPIYNQIQSMELWNCLVVVVRYFGGTKLGVPGLINAYKEAARASLENSQIVTEYLIRTVNLRFPYKLMNDVMRVVKNTGAELIQEKMGQDAGYVVGIRKNEYHAFIDKLKQFHQVQII